MTWTLAASETMCGACGVRVLAGEPLAFLTLHKKRRCRRCVESLRGDQSAAIELLYADKVERDAAAAEGRAALPGLASGRSTRHAPTRSVQAFSTAADLAGSVFDPRAAQTGDRE